LRRIRGESIMNRERSVSSAVGPVQWYRVGTLVSLLAAVCLVVSGVLLGVSVYAQTPLEIYLDPSSTTADPGDVFTVDVYVDPHGQAVGGVDVGITFATAHLEVKSLTGDASGLPVEIQNTFDNNTGELFHSRGAFSPPYPTALFRLCTIEFEAKAPVVETPLAFMPDPDTQATPPDGPEFTVEALDGDVTIKQPIGGATLSNALSSLALRWAGVMVLAGFIVGLGAVLLRRRLA
jgi:hypothetical protein